MSNKRLECARTKKYGRMQSSPDSWHNVLSPFLAEISEAICLRCGALDLTQTNIKVMNLCSLQHCLMTDNGNRKQEKLFLYYQNRLCINIRMVVVLVGAINTIMSLCKKVNASYIVTCCNIWKKSYCCCINISFSCCIFLNKELR